MLTPEQMALRSTRVGASEVGAVFGLDPYCTRFELWHRKAGLLPEEDLSENRHVFWGTVLEPAVAQGVALREGWKVKKVRRDSPHPALDCLGATLDYEVVSHPDGPGALEIKTADAYAFKQWDGEPPLRYQLQLQTQLACTGRRWGAVAVLVGGNDLHVFRYPRHEAAISRVVAEVDAFWRSLVAGEAPQPDWQADAETIARLYGSTNPDKTVDCSTDPRFSELCRLYAAHGQAKRSAEDHQKAIKAELTAMLGDAAMAYGDGCKVTARNVEPQEVKFTRRGYRDIRVTLTGTKEDA